VCCVSIIISWHVDVILAADIRRFFWARLCDKADSLV